MKESTLFLCIFWSLSSCVQEDLRSLQTSDWEPELAVPLISASYGMNDLLTAVDSISNIITDSANVITLIYQDQVFEINGEELIKLVDTSFSLEDSVLEIGLILSGETRINILELKLGQLVYEIQEQGTEDITVIIRIPQLSQNGHVFEQTISLTYQGDSLLQSTGNWDLSGYIFDFEGDSTGHFIQIEYEAFITATGTPVDLDIFRGDFKDLIYKYAEGFFGPHELGVHIGSMDLPIFEPWKSGTISFDDPRIRITLHNSFGIPLQASLANFALYDGQIGYPLNGSIFQDSLLVNYPSLDSADYLDTTLIPIHQNNSNFPTTIALSPDRLEYELGLFTALYNRPNSKHFLFDTSRISAFLDVVLPLAIRLDQVLLTDTFALEGMRFEELDFINFTLLTQNQLPISLDVQVYFLDDQNQLLDSLWEVPEQILASGPINDLGISTEPAFAQTEIILDEKKLTTIENTDRLKVKVEFNSAEMASKTVRLTALDQLSIQLSAAAGIKL